MGFLPNFSKIWLFGSKFPQKLVVLLLCFFRICGKISISLLFHSIEISGKIRRSIWNHCDLILWFFYVISIVIVLLYYFNNIIIFYFCIFINIYVNVYWNYLNRWNFLQISRKNWWFCFCVFFEFLVKFRCLFYSILSKFPEKFEGLFGIIAILFCDFLCYIYCDSIIVLF